MTIKKEVGPGDIQSKSNFDINNYVLRRYFMEKGKKLISLLLVLVLLFSLSSISLATKEDSKLNDFLGKYRGSYYANQGHTGLTLEVYKDEDMNYKASFNFYSVPENPSVPAGEYICDVEYDEDTDEYIIIG